MKLTKTQLTKMIREAVQKQLNESPKRAWSKIGNLMMHGEESGLIEDVGQKYHDVGNTHEFAIDGEIFVVVRLEDLEEMRYQAEESEEVIPEQMLGDEDDGNQIVGPSD